MDELRIKSLRYTLRHTAGRHNYLSLLQKLHIFLQKGLLLLLGDQRPRLQNLSLCTILRKDSQTRTRRTGGLHEILPDAIVLKTLGNEFPGLAAEESRCNTILTEDGRNIGHMDALAARCIVHACCAHDRVLAQFLQYIALIYRCIQIHN